jgi:hypothetical protein
MQQDSLAHELNAALPSLATRSTVCFIALFLLAILFVLLYFKMQEADKRLRKS